MPFRQAPSLKTHVYDRGSQMLVLSHESFAVHATFSVAKSVKL
jgi:hypothetical protein